MSSSSSSYSNLQRRCHPQQGYHSATNSSPNDHIIRQTPPSAASQSWQQQPSSRHSTPFYTPKTPAPLVLDSRSTPNVGPGSRLFAAEATPSPAYISAASNRRRAPPPPNQLLLSNQKIVTKEQADEPTAAAFARTAPRAGFLYKLGSNVPEFKRRFFVLKPSTHLYYFLSPHDTEPRGCIELDEGSSSIHLLESFPDGRVRFAIRLKGDGNSERQVVLEARSNGQEWIAALQHERLSHVQQKLANHQQLSVGYKQRIADLEKMVQNYQMVEQDRDGALEDAATWRNKYAQLNESVRLLTLRVRQPPEEEEEGTFLGKDKKEQVMDTPGTAPTVTMTPEEEEQVSTSLLSATEKSLNAQIDEMVNDVAETHFSALHNACQQLRENVVLAAREASTAVEDLQEATHQKDANLKRLGKAEKHLCKLWEENTAIRQELKVNKQEKRVLVREVKTLRATKAPDGHGMLQDRPVIMDGGELLDTSSTMVDSEGERLIEDLEQQVESSIRLHEDFLASNRRISVNSSQSAPLKMTLPALLNAASSDLGTTVPSDNSLHGSRSETTATSDTGGGRRSPLRPKVLSLMDDDSSNEEDDDEDEKDDIPSGLTSTVSSVGADFGDGSSMGTFDMKESLSSRYADDLDSDVESVTERMHPLLKLDEQDDDDDFSRNDMTRLAPRSNVTDNGQATSRLECPLADVIETSDAMEDAAREDGKVYHLAFYSRKIGLQFQKVPPASVANGVLTEAMTADLPTNGESGGDKTAAELRSIANMTRRAKGYADQVDDGRACTVATPVDAVLVCGFHGFDDSANHTRPKLGSRLVAFDGISVEFGKWTFESIRKAIQARGRPLTLSFRNDFLTTKQRGILTKAVAEVDAAVPLPKRTIQYRTATNQSLATRSLINPPHSRASSHDTEQFVNDSFDYGRSRDDESSVSGTSSNFRYHTFSANTSVGTGQDLRSFSEAGSVFSSTFGPLMSNLMSGISNQESESSRPRYMAPYGESLENMPGHQDFKSGLL